MLQKKFYHWLRTFLFVNLIYSVIIKQESWKYSRKIDLLNAGMLTWQNSQWIMAGLGGEKRIWVAYLARVWLGVPGFSPNGAKSFFHSEYHQLVLNLHPCKWLNTISVVYHKVWELLLEERFIRIPTPIVWDKAVKKKFHGNFSS
jgi:hypothetical protein